MFKKIAMPRLGIYCCLLLLISYLSSCQQSAPLFEAGSADWVTEGNAEWQFSEDILEGRAVGEDGFVMTRDTYDNFLLELEFFPDSTINSGVFVRCKNSALSATDCHEMNIWDLHPNQEFRTGAIVTKATPRSTLNTINQWNSYKIRCEGPRVAVWVNDTLTAEIEDMVLSKGHIGLQASGKGTIRFRNIHLKQL